MLTAHRLIGECPVCQGVLRVTRQQCTDCHSVLEGQFELSPLGKLSADHQYFVEVFIASRGNIKEVEKVLGVSYPTVRARLDSVIAALGYEVQRSTPTAVNKKAILDALDRGDMTAEEAIEKLRGSD